MVNFGGKQRFGPLSQKTTVFSGTDLVNSTTFALQNDDLQQLGCVTLWVLTWITCQNL